MEHTTKRKRRIGNRLLSLMLVLTLAMSNIQSTPNMNSTVWAAESHVAETAEQTKQKSTDSSEETTENESSETAQNSETDSNNESEEKTSEDSETESTSTEENSKAQEETDTSEDKKTEETTESDSQIEETTTEIAETETTITEEEETTEEGIEKNEGEESNPEDSNVGEQVTITVHFKKPDSWSQVAAFYGNKNDTPNWELLCENKNWPGDEVTKDDDGYYILEVKKDASKDFALVFNNNDTENELKTTDIIVDTSFFKGFDTYDFWVWIDQNNTVTYKSPEVKGSTVIFRYENKNASDVYVVGLNNNWDPSTDNLMNKNEETGIHTLTKELEHGIYSYKFNGTGAVWVADPENPFKDGDNSEFYVPGADEYQYTIHYYNPNEEENKTPDLHLWDKGIEKSWAYPAASKDCAFDSSKADAEGRTWWTATFTVPYQHLGLMGRVNAGSYTDGQDDSDREYKIETGNKVELWYVHGDGIHTENPFPVQEGLNPPELTVAKGTTTTLPSKLAKGSEDGTVTEVEVTYTLTKEAAGVALDDDKKQLTIDKTFAGTSVELTATETNGTATVTFEIKVVEDKNQITIKLHYSRPDGNYENWNVWAWSEGTEGKDGARYDFKNVKDEMIATITLLDARKNSKLGYIIRRSEEGNEWAEKDPNKDLNRFIDLSEILSGTIDCYIESGKEAVHEELAEDILKGVKILSLELDKENNQINVVTGNPIEEANLQNAFSIKLADGTEIAIKNVTAVSNKNEYIIEPADNLTSIDMLMTNEFYTISFDGYDYKLPVGEARILYSSKEFEDAFTYTGNDLGATWTKEKTTFKVWAPTANKVEVKLYDNGEKGKGTLTDTLPMTKGDKGVWSAEKTGDLHGTYYTYAVTINEETTEACDPYARTTGVNGDRAMVLNLDATDPEGWAEDIGPNQGMRYTDSVIYELHVRDFSIDPSSGISDKNKGKFLGLTEEGTTNATGQTTGLDYLKDLGVTHIHLLPSYDYATVDETKLDTPQYNWGYDPKNYNVPEGSYSTDPYKGDVRVKEMKQMVKTLHDNNINVIMDVVYNHVYDVDKFCFNQIVPQYFSRTKQDGTYSNGSGCGNDTASERAMVKKYIVDSVNYWADEYHIDGFRFDLVGLLDTETINEVVETVHQKHPNAVFYGEGWTMATEMSKDGYTMATQANASKTPQFAYFSDTIRDLLKGGNDETSLGFVSGRTGQEEPMANCFRALAGWSSSPTQIVNYASCHDNYTLKDKLDVTAGKTNSQEDVIKMNNLAAAIYLTAEGIPLIHAGEELLREKKDENGNVDHNSYKSPDAINSIKWSNLNKEEYQQTRDYYKGLIAFRKNHAALRLSTAEAIAENVQYKWITNEVIMFVINGKEQIADEISDGIVILFNATKSSQSVDLYRKGDDGSSVYGIAEGTWNVCVDSKKAGTEVLDTITDGKVEVAPISAMILVKGETEDILIKRQKLQSLVDNCQTVFDQGQETYTDESWKAFEAAFQNAKTVLKNTNAVLTEINDAYDKLEKAYKELEGSVSVPVNKQELQRFIDDCQAVLNQGQNNYTDESWQAFEAALESANAVLKKTDATQEEVDGATADLKKALDGLKVPEGIVDTGKLKALIDTCKTILEQGQANYTDESWEAFTNALNEAQTVFENPNAAQTDVDNARDKLEAARNALTNKKPNTEILDALILEYEKLEKGDYTDESWKTFEDALNAAKATVGNPNATQEEINQAEQKLRAAYNNLKVPEGTVDKGKLKALTAACKEIWNQGQGDYTSESWKAFTDALEKAEAVLANPNATQTEIDDARSALESAQNDLTSVTLETEALKALIAEYEKLKKEDYTNESWAVLSEALSTAKTVTEKPNASLDEVRKATDGLQKAFEELVKAKQGLWTVWTANAGLTPDTQGNYHIPYTGKAIKPEILVYDGKTLLREKTDYTIAYKNNTNAGTASVIIKGKGNYAKSHEENFTIDAIDIATLEIADMYAAVAGNNTRQIAPKPVVKYNGKTLKPNKDYEVKYENPQTDGKECGKTYNVIVTAKSSNFINSKTIHMTLVDKAGVRLMSKASIGKIAKEDTQYAFDEAANRGKVLKPELVVKYGKDTLNLQTDYTILYDEVHTEAGETATITVRGNGVTYVGEKTISFKIIGTPLKANQISLKDVPKTGLVYTGMKQEPEISIAGMNSEEVERYTIKTYQKNTDVGTATVLITGRNGYTGTVKKTFKITAYDILADASSRFTYNKNANNTILGEIPYAKGGSKLTDEQIGAKFLSDTGRLINLEQGKDYTLSYKNNKKVGTANVTMKGKGNYKGTIQNISFTIVPQNLAALKENIIAGDILEKNAEKYNKVIPVLTDIDGKTLKNKTDFIVVGYVDPNADDNRPIEEIQIKETPKIGDVIKIIIRANGNNYQGTTSATFRVIDNDKSISKAVIKVENQIYTGLEVRPADQAVTVTIKVKENGTTITETLKEHVDYEIIGYAKNINKGTAKLTIHGIGAYGGTKTGTFKIIAQEMK